MTKKKYNQKRVATIHDLSGYGQCSLGICIPVISCANIEVCPAPTALYSHHTAIKNPVKFDTSFMLEEYLHSWTKLKIKFDAIYTGYITDTKSADAILDFLKINKYSLKIIDPAMADFGKYYSGINDNICQSMKQLIQYADIITPNITEACLLTNNKIDEKPNLKKIKKIILDLKHIGCKNIIITGIEHDNEIVNYVYEDNNKLLTAISSESINYTIHGAGDLFCSCLVSCILNNHTLIDSVKFSCKIVKQACQISVNQPNFLSKGVCFEPMLKDISYHFSSINC